MPTYLHSNSRKHNNKHPRNVRNTHNGSRPPSKTAANLEARSYRRYRGRLGDGLASSITEIFYSNYNYSNYKAEKCYV
jgi:hypothetical protein